MGTSGWFHDWQAASCSTLLGCWIVISSTDNSGAKILHNTKIFIPSSGRVDIRLEDTSVVPGAVDHARTLALKSSVKDPGFFGIGVYRLKTDANHGTLWRSAFQFGADFIFTIGARFNKKTSRSTDTAKCWTKVGESSVLCLGKDRGLV